MESTIENNLHIYIWIVPEPDLAWGVHTNDEVEGDSEWTPGGFHEGQEEESRGVLSL